MTRCPLCGREFGESEAQVGCRGCPVAGKCNMIRCPNCGYEIPGESRLLRALKSLRRTARGTGR